ncbi:MAG: histidine kinase N-terminal domain-containing protein, partial [Bacilli bacterium]|nr:histidine kinase N-terminal domain-containing protein [Bacilli bacterium]
MSSMIRKIVITQTYLNESEIEKIIEVSKSLDLMANFYEADVFIDVLSKNDDEAIVVSHSKSKVNSLYSQNVIGNRALIKNETGVISCLKTGETIKDIKALTQEFKLVKQHIQPITLGEKVIGALIVEKDISNEVKGEFYINKDNKNQNSKEFINLIKNNNFLTDNLNAAILIYDKDGKLKIKNKRAVEMYENIGFKRDIQNMHYNELHIDKNRFEEILLDENYNETTEISR